MRGFRAAALAALAVLALGGAAVAQPNLGNRRPIPIQAPAVQVSCDYLEIQASTSKTNTIDAGLKVIEKKLKKGPFKQWTEFKMLSSGSRALKKGKTEAVTLKQGGMSATLVEIVDKSKIRLKVEINNAKGKAVANNTVLFDAGDWVIMAVTQPNGDGHLTALTCK